MDTKDCPDCWYEILDDRVPCVGCGAIFTRLLVNNADDWEDFVQQPVVSYPK